jgi:hypothetical protein
VIESTTAAYHAQLNAGLIIIDDGTNSVQLGRGSALQLVESSETWIYWIGTDNVLRRASIHSQLSIGNTEILTTGVSSFFVRDVPGRGIACAYVRATTLYIDMFGYLSSGSWPIERLPDFSFDISDDLQTISVLYLRPGSPTQAYIEYYSQSDTPEPVPDTEPRIPNSPSSIYYNFYKAKYENY